MEENIVKNVCAELGINQKELAEQIGAAEATVRNWSAGKEIPAWAHKSMDMLIELKKYRELSTTAKKFINLIQEIK
ncbi:helix-turn-helix transcriptional regulator [Sulfurospirillum cavolei]|uniref:helix-turn-helix transcriptional regulator n=1 Tax=Sulfurospirillum cavolei TaxID=366522 RepID=UPI000764B8A5|nr:helix-turn-helix transcriptional regulator [Sulfurospirillum cavolei]